MKRIGGIFDRIGDADTLLAATHRAAAGKRHRPEVSTFLSQLDLRIPEMGFQLREGIYSFSEYRSFPIQDPKSRTIHAPVFADRVAHHAMIARAGPVFELGATGHSYACRKGRGLHLALERMKAAVSRKHWFLKMDVASFYDSLSHKVLMDKLAKRFRERRLLELFERLLESYHSERGRGFGLPIGALTSQYFGNFFLDQMDHTILSKIRTPCYIRYMDDILILGLRDDLLEARELAAREFALLGLEIKHHGVLNRAECGIPFPGFTVFPDRVRLNRNGRRRLRRKFRTLETARVRGTWCEAEAQRRANSLFAHAAVADDIAGRRKMILTVMTEPPPPPSDHDSRDRQENDWQPRSARRLLDQHGAELPRRDPQQEQGRQPQQEQRLPPWSFSRHGGIDAPGEAHRSTPPDDACSGSRTPGGCGSESTRQSSSATDTASKEFRGGKGADEAAGNEEKTS